MDKIELIPGDGSVEERLTAYQLKCVRLEARARKAEADCQLRLAGLQNRIRQLEAEVERLQSSGDRAAELIERLEPYKGNLRLTPPNSSPSSGP